MSTAETLNNDFRLENFFVGDFVSDGVFVKPNGKIIRRFKVEGQSNFKKGTLTLNEKFTYDDGVLNINNWYRESALNPEISKTITTAKLIIVYGKFYVCRMDHTKVIQPTLLGLRPVITQLKTFLVGLIA